MNILKKENGYTCAICGRDFNSYNSAYVHLRRIHPTHPSMNREVYNERNIPSAPLFTHPETVRHESEYSEPVYHERSHIEERDFEKRDEKEKDNSAAIVIFFLGLIALGVWIYFRYFKGKFNFFSTVDNSDDDEDIEPAFRVNNSVPVTKDGAWPVFEVRQKA
jgi:hypothetical protein